MRVGVRPKSVQSPTDMSSELSTVTTAARASPHLDLTMSILPIGQKGHTRAAHPQTLAHRPLTELPGVEGALTAEGWKSPA